MARTAIIAAAAFLWLATPAQAIFAPAWRSIVVPRGLVPPADREGPLLVLIDTPVDAAHPALAGADLVTSTEPVRDAHGTAMASIAVAVWPSVRIMVIARPDTGCFGSAQAIQRAVDARASVISMAYGSATNCGAEWAARHRAVAAGSLLVASAGNDSDAPPEYPAAGEHVLAVGAIAWVNGRLLKQPNIWSGGAARTITARLRRKRTRSTSSRSGFGRMAAPASR